MLLEKTVIKANAVYADWENLVSHIWAREMLFREAVLAAGFMLMDHQLEADLEGKLMRLLESWIWTCNSKLNSCSQYWCKTSMSCQPGSGWGSAYIATDETGWTGRNSHKEWVEPKI